MRLLSSLSANTNSGPSSVKRIMTKSNSASGACPQSDTSSALIQGFRFCPSPLRVQPGTTVTWTNDDNVVHTITSRAGPHFDSGRLAQGQSWSHRFDRAGTFAYYCAVHPWMQGSVEVTT